MGGRESKRAVLVIGSGMHAHHPFACKESRGEPWVAAPPRAAPPTGEMPRGAIPRSDTSQLEAALAALQHREITPDDYELLLAMQQAEQHAASGRTVPPNGRGEGAAESAVEREVEALVANLNAREALQQAARRREAEHRGRLASQAAAATGARRTGRLAAGGFGSSAHRLHRTNGSLGSTGREGGPALPNLQLTGHALATGLASGRGLPSNKPP